MLTGSGKVQMFVSHNFIKMHLKGLKGYKTLELRIKETETEINKREGN